MDETQRLKLPLILAAQAQKHVTHNEALRALDCIVQLSVLDRDLTAPPSTPAEGDRYIVATSPTGTWTGHGGDVAAWQSGAWGFYAPQLGWIAWVADEDSLLAWDGASWVVAGGGVNPTPLVGVNATADSTNRLSIKSAASLFDNDGNGSPVSVTVPRLDVVRHLRLGITTGQPQPLIVSHSLGVTEPGHLPLRLIACLMDNCDASSAHITASPSCWRRLRQAIPNTSSSPELLN